MKGRLLLLAALVAVVVVARGELPAMKRELNIIRM